MGMIEEKYGWQIRDEMARQVIEVVHTKDAQDEAISVIVYKENHDPEVDGTVLEEMEQVHFFNWQDQLAKKKLKQIKDAITDQRTMAIVEASLRRLSGVLQEE